MSNPFAILSSGPAATKREILAAVPAALRAGHFDARMIAEAQKTLFDPLARAVAEFEHCFDACGHMSSRLPDFSGELIRESTGDGSGPIGESNRLRFQRLC